MTQRDINDEQDSINKIKIFRPMHADASIKTAHFIKKAVMLPLESEGDGPNTLKVSNPQNPFMRGIMAFDDYNYCQFNEHILVENPSKADVSRQKLLLPPASSAGQKD